MSNQLNINPEMDKLAREHGLGHWSCVSPLNNAFWVRSDGINCAIDVMMSDIFCINSLRQCDKEYPIGEDWQKPKQPTLVQSELPEKAIVSNGCHECYFASMITMYRVHCYAMNKIVTDLSKQKQRHNECPLNTHSIKVVK